MIRVSLTAVNDEGQQMSHYVYAPISTDEIYDCFGHGEIFVQECSVIDAFFDVELTGCDTLEDVNHIAEQLQTIEGTAKYFELPVLLQAFFTDVHEFLERKENLKLYEGCRSIYDVVVQKVMFEGLAGIPEQFINSGLDEPIDYEAYGEYLEGTKQYVHTMHGIFEYAK